MVVQPPVRPQGKAAGTGNPAGGFAVSPQGKAPAFPKLPAAPLWPRSGVGGVGLELTFDKYQTWSLPLKLENGIRGAAVEKARYEQYADDCRQLAKQTKNAEQRKRLEEMAEVWERLARERRQGIVESSSGTR